MVRGSILPALYARLQVSPAESCVLQVIARAANVIGQNARLSYELPFIQRPASMALSCFIFRNFCGVKRLAPA